MLRAGQRHLEAVGVSVGLEAIRFDEVARECEIPRASAYRAWDDGREGGQQDALRLAIARSALADQISFDSEEGTAFDATLEGLAPAFARLPDLHALTREERRAWLDELVRVGGNTNQRVGAESALFPCYVALAAGITSRQMREDDPLWDAWRSGERSSRTRYVDLYQSAADMFGMRLRSPFTWEQFGTIVASLAEGLGIRAPINPDGLDHIAFDTPHQTDDTGWSLLAIGLRAFVEVFFEPDESADETGTGEPH